MTQDLKNLPFGFHGDGPEYFRIWIVNVCLSIVTLGIYSAWAKVRTRRYFYGNTTVDGHAFGYLADPVRILKGRLIAVAALGVYFFIGTFHPAASIHALTVLLLLLPAAMVMAAGFNMRNTAYRHVRFRFARDFAGVYRMLLPPLLVMLVLTWAGYHYLGSTEWVHNLENSDEMVFSRTDLIPMVLGLSLLPLLPYLDYLRVRFMAERTGYGTQRMGFMGTVGQFYWIYLGTLLLGIGMMVVAFGVLLVLGLIAGVAATLGGVKPDDLESNVFMVMMMGLGVVVMYSLMFFVGGYLRARRLNLVYNNLTIGESRVTSRLRARDIGWIFLSNTFAIVATLGMLIPWAKVRLARYQAGRTSLEAHQDLGSIAAATDHERSAIGEELGESFGFDLGI